MTVLRYVTASVSYSETSSPGEPTAVSTESFSDSVLISWQPPKDDTAVVRGYKVGYSEGIPDLNWRYVDGTQRNVTIENLSE